MRLYLFLIATLTLPVGSVLAQSAGPALENFAPEGSYAFFRANPARMSQRAIVTSTSETRPDPETSPWCYGIERGQVLTVGLNGSYAYYRGDYRYGNNGRTTGAPVCRIPKRNLDIREASVVRAWGEASEYVASAASLEPDTTHGYPRADVVARAAARAGVAPYLVPVSGPVNVYGPDKGEYEYEYPLIATAAAGDSLAVLTTSQRAPRSYSDPESVYEVLLEGGDAVVTGFVWAREFSVPPALESLIRGQRAAISNELEIMQDEFRSRQAELEAEIFADTPDLLITEFRALVDYYTSGFRLNFQNLKAGKTINYLRMTVRPYNRVGDRITSRQGGGDETVTAVGPAEPSVSGVYTYENDGLWPTELVDCVRLLSVTAEYRDGTSKTWRNSLNSIFEGGRWDNCSDR